MTLSQMFSDFPSTQPPEIVNRANSEHWLGRLLLRAGSDVSVVSPDKWVDLASRTANAVLARYSADNPGN